MYVINLPQSSLRRGGFTTNEVVFIFYFLISFKGFLSQKAKDLLDPGCAWEGKGTHE